MKVLIKTKLLVDGEKRYCECREYELFKGDIKIIHCVAENCKKCYHLGEEYMVLTLAKQKEGKVVNTQTSMFPPFKTYRMYKYKWSPKGSVENKQVSEMDIEFSGNTAKLP